jgi:putative endonuclease
MAYYVYMLASKRNGTLYIGVTNDVIRRTYEHRERVAESFTKQYGVRMLVWYEQAPR